MNSECFQTLIDVWLYSALERWKSFPLSSVSYSVTSVTNVINVLDNRLAEAKSLRFPLCLKANYDRVLGGIKEVIAEANRPPFAPLVRVKRQHRISRSRYGLWHLLCHVLAEVTAVILDGVGLARHAVSKNVTRVLIIHCKEASVSPVNDTRSWFPTYLGSHATKRVLRNVDYSNKGRMVWPRKLRQRNFSRVRNPTNVLGVINLGRDIRMWMARNPQMWLEIPWSLTFDRFHIWSRVFAGWSMTLAWLVLVWRYLLSGVLKSNPRWFLQGHRACLRTVDIFGFFPSFSTLPRAVSCQVWSCKEHSPLISLWKLTVLVRHIGSTPFWVVAGHGWTINGIRNMVYSAAFPIW